MRTRTVIDIQTHGERVIRHLPVDSNGWAALHPTSSKRIHQTHARNQTIKEKLLEIRASSKQQMEPA